MKYIGFVLSLPQASIKTDICMKQPKVPKEFEITGLPNFTDHFIYVYNQIKNLYGLKDDRKTWHN